MWPAALCQQTYLHWRFTAADEPGADRVDEQSRRLETALEIGYAEIALSGDNAERPDQ